MSLLAQERGLKQSSGSACRGWQLSLLAQERGLKRIIGLWELL